MSNAPQPVRTAQQTAGSNGRQAGLTQPAQARNAVVQAGIIQQPAQAPREFAKALDDKKPALAQTQPPTQAKKQLKVIVADDKEWVHRFVGVNLQAIENVTVLHAENPDEVFALLVQHSDVGLVISDVNMTKSGDGYDLFKRLKTEQPQIKVHLMTKDFTRNRDLHSLSMKHAGVTDQDISDKGDIEDKLNELVEKARAA